MATALRNRPEQELGTRYRVRHLLGRGSRATVWRAENEDGEAMALKFLVCGDSLTASNWLWSLRAQRELGHPHVVHIEDFTARTGNIVVAMELADGTLLDCLKQSRAKGGNLLPAARVVEWLKQAADAIDFLNGRKPGRDGRRPAFQHGGVRPSNLLCFGDTVKLADAGPVLPVNMPLKFRHWSGPLDFAAPEVFRGRLSEWTDQYALAVTYCQLRGGRLPFTDTPTTLRRDYVRPEPNLSMVPAEERAIVGRALAVQPWERWPSCCAFMAALSAR